MLVFGGKVAILPEILCTLTDTLNVFPGFVRAAMNMTCRHIWEVSSFCAFIDG